MLYAFGWFLHWRHAALGSVQYTHSTLSCLSEILSFYDTAGFMYLSNSGLWWDFVYICDSGPLSISAMGLHTPYNAWPSQWSIFIILFGLWDTATVHVTTLCGMCWTSLWEPVSLQYTLYISGGGIPEHLPTKEKNWLIPWTVSRVMSLMPMIPLLSMMFFRPRVYLKGSVSPKMCSR
jgi:hypothetical protein